MTFESSRLNFETIPLNYRCRTPVIFFVFNRPSTTQRVFDRIAEARPERILIVADAPRPWMDDDAERCKEVYRIVENISWPCQRETHFASQHMGCRDRIISGLTWAFDQVEEAIILEDDILPDLSFFMFCEEMLARYRGDSRISMITGFNLVHRELRTSYSYFFSQLTHIWGWATWRRSWRKYDPHLRSWPQVRDANLLREIFENPDTIQFWTRVFDSMHIGTGPNTWDYQWMFTHLIQNTLCVVPHVNLVDNIGFGAGATHTILEKDAPMVEISSIKFPLRHPPSLIPLRSMDRLSLEISGCSSPPLPDK